jgi:hypothetical protein
VKNTFGPGTLLQGHDLGKLGRSDGHSQVHRKGPGPSRHLGQLTLKGLNPARGLGSLAPRLVPLVDGLTKHQLPLLCLRPCQRRLCPRRRCLRLQIITKQPKVRQLGALSGKALIGLGKRGPLGPRRNPDATLTMDEQRLGGAYIRQFLSKEDKVLQIMPWPCKVCA